MMIGNVTGAALYSALRGLDARRAAHEHNIANVETPGYKARSVAFEDQLRRALEQGSDVVASSTPKVNASRAGGRANGNNVDVAQEMVSLTETALTQELLIRAMNDKYGLIRTALGQA